MDLAGYRIDLNQITDTIRNKKAKTIALQLPEGLRTHALSLITRIEQQTSSTVLVCADPCYGACDLSSGRLHSLNVDLVITSDIPRSHIYQTPSQLSISTRSHCAIPKQSSPKPSLP
jgi:diphthamide synthase subunit DPH2